MAACGVQTSFSVTFQVKSRIFHIPLTFQSLQIGQQPCLVFLQKSTEAVTMTGTCNFPNSSAPQKAVRVVLTLRASAFSKDAPGRNSQNSFFQTHVILSFLLLVLFSVLCNSFILLFENINPKITSNFDGAITQNRVCIQALLCSSELHRCPQAADLQDKSQPQPNSECTAAQILLLEMS